MVYGMYKAKNSLKDNFLFFSFVTLSAILLKSETKNSHCQFAAECGRITKILILGICHCFIWKSYIKHSLKLMIYHLGKISANKQTWPLRLVLYSIILALVMTANATKHLILGNPRMDSFKKWQISCGTVLLKRKLPLS